MTRYVILLVVALITLPLLAGASPPPPFTLQWGVAGSGPGQFDNPSGVIVDAFGNVLLVDAENDRVGWSGGFDVVLGNPPWERIKLQEKEFFASRAPVIANATNAASRKRQIAALKSSDPLLYAAFCTALREYLLTVQTHGAGKLLLFSSPDGLDWSLETIIDHVSNGAIQPYSSFVDFDGPSADCHTVDDDFFIYFPRKGPDHDHDYMYRRSVKID